MESNSPLRNVQNNLNINYSGVQELKNTEQGLQFYTKDIVKKIKKALKITEGTIVLDFGAGTGQLAELWRDNYSINPTCLEIDPMLVEILIKKKFKVFQKIEQIQEKFAFVYTSNVLEHIEDDLATLIDIKNIMSVNGRLVIYVPALKFLFSNFDVSVGHYRRYSKKELIEKVTDAGFKVEKCFWNDSLGVLASLVVKLLSSKGKYKTGGVKSLLIYDKVVYPISKILDFFLFKYLIGKNLFLIAVNSNVNDTLN